MRGAQVAPAELEALLLEHPQIMDAAVVGIKTYAFLGFQSAPCADQLCRPTDDEDPRAYVVLRIYPRLENQASHGRRCLR